MSTDAPFDDAGWSWRATAALLSDCILLERLTGRSRLLRPAKRLEAEVGAELVRLLVPSLCQRHGSRSCVGFRC
jgi:hypothetical protein